MIIPNTELAISIDEVKVWRSNPRILGFDGQDIRQKVCFDRVWDSTVGNGVPSTSQGTGVVVDQVARASSISSARCCSTDWSWDFDCSGPEGKSPPTLALGNAEFGGFGVGIDVGGRDGSTWEFAYGFRVGP
jgi:hypothetical protein